jgi:uncharacterized membrane protein YbhN (UPF0104 family)
MKSRRLLFLLLALGATAVVGYFVVRQLRWSEIARLGATADLRFLLLGFVSYLCANVLRARRFRALTGDRLATATLLSAVFFQNIFNTFLPLRAGEVSYLYMVHRTGEVKPADSLGSLLGARVLDLVAALLLPAIALPFSRARFAEGSPLLWILLIGGGSAAALALGIWQAERLASFLAGRAGSSRAIVNRALLMLADTLRSLARLRKASLMSRVGALTFGCWLLVYVSGYFSLLGVGLSIPFADAVFAYSFPNIASMTPFYMLGGFGVFEGTFGFGLHLVGVPLKTAVASSLLLHVAELLFVLLPAPLALALRARKTP